MLRLSELQRRRLAVAVEQTSREKVMLTTARLDQLLEAEITQLSMRDAQMMNLQSVLDSRRSPEELARLLHEELPVRFAQRVVMLESLPDWSKKEPIVYVRQLYVTSFKELRLADPEQPAEFQAQLHQIKKRHSHTHQLVRGLKSYSQWSELREAEVNEWLDRFFVLRVSTNMLIAHYLRVARGEDRSLPEFAGDVNPYQSTVNKQCNPCAIVRISVPIIERMCFNRYGIAPEIEVRDVGSQPFPFVPRYLFYILSELLKNSARATIEQHGASERKIPPICILVSGDENGASIRIRDQGGGIPVSKLATIWSYLYSTAEPLSEPLTRAAVDDPLEVRRLQDLGSDFREPGYSEVTDPVFDGLIGSNSLNSLSDCLELAIHAGSPLAGLGCGLPLSRLYARYLGGKIELQTLPRYGTDMFVYISRLGHASKDLPML